MQDFAIIHRMFSTMTPFYSQSCWNASTSTAFPETETSWVPLVPCVSFRCSASLIKPRDDDDDDDEDEEEDEYEEEEDDDDDDDYDDDDDGDDDDYEAGMSKM